MAKVQSLWPLLPDEIKLECFSHLSELDLCRAARVCSQWMHLSMDASLWPEYAIAVKASGHLPSPRVCHSAVTYNQKMVIYGGHNPAPGILIHFSFCLVHSAEGHKLIWRFLNGLTIALFRASDI
jgi:hypothetical protein